MSEGKRRIAFNDECFAWLMSDETLDPLPMPLDWRHDARGAQIEDSRLRWGCYAEPVYSADARYPSRDERLAPARDQLKAMGYVDYSRPIGMAAARDRKPVIIDLPSWLMIIFGAMLWLLACGILVGLMGWLK